MSPSSEKPVEIVLFSLECDDEKRKILYRSLSDDEKQRAAAFRFDKHRNRFIAGRGRIREILADRTGCTPADIVFRLNPYGKPSIREPDHAMYLRFNASSSETLGAIALSNHDAIGFDIEKVKPGKLVDYDLIVEHQFTAEEYDWYAEHTERFRSRAFFQLWTCKEAYLKAVGTGLSGELKSFSIDLRAKAPVVSRTELEDSASSKFRLRQFELEDGFIACLASPKAVSQVYFTHC